MIHALEQGLVIKRNIDKGEMVLVSVVGVDSFEHFAVLATPQLANQLIIILLAVVGRPLGCVAAGNIQEERNASV